MKTWRWSLGVTEFESFYCWVMIAASSFVFCFLNEENWAMGCCAPLEPIFHAVVDLWPPESGSEPHGSVWIFQVSREKNRLKVDSLITASAAKRRSAGVGFPCPWIKVSHYHLDANGSGWVARGSKMRHKVSKWSNKILKVAKYELKEGILKVADSSRRLDLWIKKLHETKTRRRQAKISFK